MRAVLMTLAVLCTMAAPAAAGPHRAGVRDAPPSAWRAVLEGGVARTNSYDDGETEPAVHVAITSRDEYRGSITVTFNVQADGTVVGTGMGEYTRTTWHIEGVNGSAGRFSCDPLITAAPFPVQVTGTATAERVVLDVRFPAAREATPDFDCGSDYTGFAAESANLSDSWEAVGGHAVAFDPSAPTVPVLKKDDSTTDASNVGTTSSSWRVALTRTDGIVPDAPVTPPPPTGPGAPGGTPGSEPPIGNGPPVPAQCTIVGTPGDDVLSGSDGRDIICGLAGNDRINGNGGNDLLAGGPGRDLLLGGRGADRLFGGIGADLIAAGDRVRDVIVAGAGRDRVWMDEGLDRAWGAEVRHLIPYLRTPLPRPDPAPDLAEARAA